MSFPSDSLSIAGLFRGLYQFLRQQARHEWLGFGSLGRIALYAESLCSMR